MFDLIVIGAGPAGCISAIAAAKKGASVLVLEKNEKPLKKLYATGNGKCNFTNEYMEKQCFRGNTELLCEILSQFTKEETIDFLHEIGVYPENKNGYYYPSSEQAASVVRALLTEMARLGITAACLSSVTRIDKRKQFFEVYTKEHKYLGKRVVIACGLKAAPKLGSDGSMFGILKELGHRFVPIVPALCGFYCKGADFKKIAGVRAGASVSVYVEDELVATDKGELQLTEYGISGIPVFQVSRFISYALYEKKNVRVKLSFLPDIADEELKEELMKRIRRAEASGGRSKLKIEELLNGLLPQKLSGEIENMISAEHAVIKLSDEKLKMLLFDAIRNRIVSVEKARDFEFAQVCAGGIKTEDIDIHTLESKLVSGLFFAGEVLDIDGICGGYNLQWAWSSGYVAGSHAIMDRE